MQADALTKFTTIFARLSFAAALGFPLASPLFADTFRRVEYREKSVSEPIYDALRL
jgi:hypothetical protein